VGVDACTDCHDDARKVWDKTTHAHAYPTLQKDFKEYNLDCVSCHVTGYDKPGGSTVTHNEKLQNVQCETCHGPGSLHVKDPGKKGLIVASPKADICVGCHHPPHVEGFDPKEKMPLILGPGHGQPKG
jgi:Cytochrome c554 and c-prime